MATPHDELFHLTFQHPRHAAGWLASILPPAMARAIDWSTLRAAPEKIHGHRVRQRITDIVFTAELHVGRHVIFLVVEHKSYVDPELHDQVLYYSVNLAARTRQAHDPPTLVVPIVLRHGKGGGPARTRTHAHLEQLDPDAVAAFERVQPRVHFLIDDLGSYSEPELRRPHLTALAQLTHLCHEVLPGLTAAAALTAIDRWGDLLRAVDRDEGPPRGAAAIDAVAWYCLQVTEIPDQELHDVFERHLQRPEDTIMSTAERLRREGHAKGHTEGHTEGRTEGRAEVILLLLQQRFGDLPTAIPERVLAASLPELDRWAKRILEAATLADVFAD